MAASVTNYLGELGGRIAVARAEFTRPADTTAYAVSDAVANSTTVPVALTFAGCGRANGCSGYVTKARLTTDQSANVTSFKLHLFNAAPTPINDNAAFTLLYANRTSYLGSITFAAAGTEGAGSTGAVSQDISSRIAFVCAAADTALYGLLETLGVFTPANAQNFSLELHCDQN